MLSLILNGVFLIGLFNPIGWVWYSGIVVELFVPHKPEGGSK